MIVISRRESYLTRQKTEFLQGEAKTLHQQKRDAAILVQRVYRSGKWRRLIFRTCQTNIAVIWGPCGFIGYPIVRSGELHGIEGPSGRMYMYRSFNMMDTTHPLRLFIISIVDNPWFERASLLAVGLNCYYLAAEGVPPPDATSGSEDREFAFTLLFTAEMVLRSSALGFSGHPWSYLGDKWNWIDFSVVIMSW